MIFGMIGVGHLGAVLVEALLAAGHPADRLRLTARGKGATLAARHGIATGTAAEVVAAADLVFLVVRPADAARAVTGLPWRTGQRLVSACAGVRADVLGAALSEGVAVHRIMPLTAAAQAASPTLLHPADPVVATAIAGFGPVIPVATEAEFETATVFAAVYGWLQKLVQVGADWAAMQGLPATTARQLSALTAVAAGRNIAGSALPMDALLRDLVTPGGITELGLGILDRTAVPGSWEAACDAVLARLRG